MQPRKILLFTHLVPEVTDPVLGLVLNKLAEQKACVAVPKSEAAKHRAFFELCPVPWEEWADADVPHRAAECSLCLVLGGDGTALRALRATRGKVPVAGINLGRVGFLSTLQPERIEQDLPRILRGEAKEYSLPVLELHGEKADWSPETAFNDIVFTRPAGQTLCQIGYSLNNVPLFDLRCDALVVATPVGSSAYNLSCGGPVLGANAQAFVITYVAPHTLVHRSVVAASEDVLRVTNTSVRDPAVVLIDAVECGVLEPGCSVEIRFVTRGGSLALLAEGGLYHNFRERFL